MTTIETLERDYFVLSIRGATEPYTSHSEVINESRLSQVLEHALPAPGKVQLLIGNKPDDFFHRN